jgi:cytochrome c
MAIRCQGGLLKGMQMHLPTPLRCAAALLCGLLFCGLAPASQALATKAGCSACLAVDKKLIGPAFHDIAARYKGNAAAPALLAERVRQGGKGVWGAVAMPPTPPERISDADLKTVLSWVLKTP